ncbi:MAG TPA: hypothetical protein VFU88_17150 [Ktedonobacterales bacterium]|nr:hypothetical protein [Ktedonobacterales bacterium]
MRKIISLFQRNYETDRLVRDELVPGAEWVAAGEGVATRKYDGTACLIRDGRLYKRYDAKRGKTPPADFEAAQEEPDEVTGHWPGWLPVGEGPEDRWHREALVDAGGVLPDGTYELVGPKVQGNAERRDRHVLIPHGRDVLPDAPRDFAGLRAYLAARDVEGIVWWRDIADPDCDKVKLKKRDLALPRSPIT